MDKGVHDKSVAWQGELFEIEQTIQPDGRVFERAVRPPGVRIIISDKKVKKILLSKEYRNELSSHDFRLPGGKVFDSLEEYDVVRKNGDDIIPYVKKQAQVEASQEVGINVGEAELLQVSKLGATIEWDLYIIEAFEWQINPEGQQLEEGERIETPQWFKYEEAKKLILDGQMQEERVALILLQWLSRQ